MASHPAPSPRRTPLGPDTRCDPQVQRAAKAAGAMKADFVAASGAFHSSRMDAAAAALKAAMEGVMFSKPRIPVFSNVTGAPFPDAASIPGLLARQLVEPVRWESSLQAMLSTGHTEMYELGPGAQIKACFDNAPYLWGLGFF